MAEADQSLLFGVLALQRDFISREALTTAVSHWIRDKTRTLDQVLVEQGALSASDRALLEPLVREHLSAHGDDPAQGLATVGAIGPVHRDLERLDDRDIHATRAHVPATRLGEDVDDLYRTRALSAEMPATWPSSVGAPSSSGLRFRILREHAKGGLGVVHVAHDGELNREVALKEIKLKHADNPDSRSRFLVEAEITGGLEHPGIVPVYGLGRYDDGRPFYAMRFIRGDSLLDAIERFHRSEELRRDPGARALALQELLRRFLDVCNAIDYAHNRGVLHRDLKPGNIMIGKYGETLVVDWGLAKPLSRPDGAATSEEPPLCPSTTSGTAETQHGSAVGTPQYMSPEQAAGELDRLGPASDVYSLGATLYHLLTGRAPFQDRDIGAVLRAVGRGDFPPPRRLDATIAPALEAICLKAMALRPEDRYRAPGALADDLKHWLADEPVSAHREDFRRRAARWMRRHRAATQAAAASLAIITAVSLASAVAINRARGRVSQALEHETHARAEAQASFLQARKTVDDYLTLVSESIELRHLPGLQPFRAELLRKALAYYQDFLKAHGDEEGLRAEVADAHVRVALVTAEIGSKPDALRAYQKALALQEPLARAHPGDTTLQRALAGTYNNLGLLQRATGQPADAERSYQQARDLRARLAADHPNVLEFQGDLAATFNNLGVLQSETSRPDDAERSYLQARAIRARLAAANPGVLPLQDDLARTDNNLGHLQSATGRFADAERSFDQAREVQSHLAAARPDIAAFQTNLATTLLNLGVLQRTTGRSADAERSYQQAREIQARLADANPGVTEYQAALATTLNNLAILQVATGRPDDAERSYQQAAEIQTRLAAANPDVPQFQNDLARTHGNLGLLQRATGRPSDAERSYEQARAIQTRLAAANPGVPEFQAALATTETKLGVLQRATGRPADAERSYEQARTIQTNLVAANPGVTEYQASLAATFNNLGNLQAATGRSADALRSYEQARAIRARLAAAHPGVTEFQGDLADTANNLGVLQRALGRSADAEQSYEQARDIGRRLIQEQPGDLNVQSSLGLTLSNLGSVLEDLGRVQEALAAYEEALDHLQVAFARSPRSVRSRYDLSVLYFRLAWLQRRLNHPAAAAEATLKRQALWAGDAKELYLVACELAQCIPLGAEGDADRRRHGDQAMTALGQAIDAGWDDFATLIREADLDPLRPRDDFQALMLSLLDRDFPKDPFRR